MNQQSLREPNTDTLWKRLCSFTDIKQRAVTKVNTSAMSHFQQSAMPAPHHSIFYRQDALPDAQPTVSKHWRQQMCWFSSSSFKPGGCGINQQIVATYWQPLAWCKPKSTVNCNKSSAVAEMGDRGHNRHGPKRGGGCCELGPGLTQCGLGRGLLTYQVASSSIQPFGHNRHGTKIGQGLCSFFWGGAGSPSNTKSPGLRPTSIPSGRTLTENWGRAVPFRGGGA